MRTTPLLTALTLTVLASGCASAPRASIPDWQEPPSYTFTIDSSCGEPAFFGYFHVTVTDGAVAEVQVADGSSRPPAGWQVPESVPTLAELLEEATEAAEHGADVVQVQTAADGHPTRIEIDRDTAAVDDELCYHITEFAPAALREMD